VYAGSKIQAETEKQNTVRAQTRFPASQWGLESGNRAFVPKKATERRLAKPRSESVGFFSFGANLR
jgi:hypothetical protein